MIDFDPRAGSSIKPTIRDMIALAKKENEIVFCYFNGFRIEVTKNSNESEIYQLWEEYQNQKNKEYLASDEYKNDCLERSKKVSELENKRDYLMNSLESLDMTDFEKVLSWFSQMQEPSDHVDVKIDAVAILQNFKEAGFEKNVNIGPFFNENDKENYARYIIGQCLDGLSSYGSIHYMAVVFTDKWKNKFL